jgi:hypothetical protein
MSRIPLIVQGLTDISDAHDTSLLILTDKEGQRQISIVCSGAIREAFAMRRMKYCDDAAARAKHIEDMRDCLPETLSALIKYLTDMELSVIIVNVFNGEYNALIEDKKTGTSLPIRVAEGALLSYADPHIPLYIEQSLWQRQSVPYMGENARGIAMPLNTLSMEMLNNALQKCIEEENYELAQQLKLEIDRRMK